MNLTIEKKRNQQEDDESILFQCINRYLTFQQILVFSCYYNSFYSFMIFEAATLHSPRIDYNQKKT